LLRLAISYRIGYNAPIDRNSPELKTFMAIRKSITKAVRKRRLKTIPWDSAAYLKTESDISDYLEAVFEDGDPALIADALGIVARAKGMTKIARATGLGRESLYKALSPGGNPELATVLKVMHALGLKLKVAA
jgi:probable addiction module antidote protein